MLAPKRVKFRKRFKGRTSGMATRGNTVAFGHYGLMSLDPGWVSNRQIEAARVALTREMKRGRIMFELEGIDEASARAALALASAKLPIRSKFVKREER